MRTTTNRPANRFELMRLRLRDRAHEPGANPKAFAILILAAIKDRLWEQVKNENDKPFLSFDVFLRTPEPYGLGMDRPKLLHVAALAGIEREVKAALDLEEPLRDEPGRPTKSESVSEKGYPVTIKPQRGNSESYLRRRLARDHPRVYTKVVSGELKAKEAARQVGIVKPTKTVPVDTPENALRPLIKEFGIPRLERALNALKEPQ